MWEYGNMLMWEYVNVFSFDSVWYEFVMLPGYIEDVGGSILMIRYLQFALSLGVNCIIGI